MKTNPIRVLSLLAKILAFAAAAQAADLTYAQILKQRDAVLSEILAVRESHYATGAGDADAVWSARLALLTFRRDTAPSAAEKIRQQEMIMGGWEKRLADVEARLKAGLGGPEAKLLATDSVLQARQVLVELQALLK